MSPFCLRLQHRAAFPAHSSGEVKGEGEHPAAESSSTMVEKEAVSSSLLLNGQGPGRGVRKQSGWCFWHPSSWGWCRESQPGAGTSWGGRGEGQLAPSSVSCLCLGTPQGFSQSQNALDCTVKSDKSQINSEFSVAGGTRRWRKLTSSILLSTVTGSRYLNALHTGKAQASVLGVLSGPVTHVTLWALQQTRSSGSPAQQSHSLDTAAAFAA